MSPFARLPTDRIKKLTADYTDLADKKNLEVDFFICVIREIRGFYLASRNAI